MQSRISPDNWQKVSGLGIYQSILNRAVLQIWNFVFFYDRRSFTDFTALYTVLSFKKWLLVFWKSRML